MEATHGTYVAPFIGSSLASRQWKAVYGDSFESEFSIAPKEAAERYASVAERIQ